MKNIHDSRILSYNVDFEYSKLTIKIIDDNGQYSDLLFKDVFAFHFEEQLPHSIILDILEDEVDIFYTDNKEILDKGKDYYWPMDYENSEEILSYIKSKSYRYYKIQSSYGLNGWILSRALLVK